MTSLRSTVPLAVMSTFTVSTMSRYTSFFLYCRPSRRQLTAPVTCIVVLRDSSARRCVWVRKGTRRKGTCGGRTRRSVGSSSECTPSCVMYSFSDSALRIWG